MLDGAGDADRHVQLRRNDLARLPDLQRVVRVARIDGRARRADRRAECIRERLQRGVERLRILQRATTRDDAARNAEFRAVRLGQVRPDVLRRRARHLDRVERLVLCLGVLLRGGGERRRAHGEELDGHRGRGAHGRNRVACVDRSREGRCVVCGVMGEGGDVRDGREV